MTTFGQQPGQPTNAPAELKDPTTQGLSPKAPSAAAGAVAAPGLARLIALLFDVELPEGAEAAILLILSGIGGLAGAYAGKVGVVRKS